ncbi:MAG: hypothetical protein RI918_1386 [Pseudomonadota bacterium]|jgi:hypothetical protein
MWLRLSGKVLFKSFLGVKYGSSLCIYCLSSYVINSVQLSNTSTLNSPSLRRGAQRAG